MGDQGHRLNGLQGLVKLLQNTVSSYTRLWVNSGLCTTCLRLQVGDCYLIESRGNKEILLKKNFFFGFFVHHGFFFTLMFIFDYTCSVQDLKSPARD